MPIRESSDRLGDFFQYGHSGKKYYYRTPRERFIAYQKCLQQTRAIARSKYSK